MTVTKIRRHRQRGVYVIPSVHQVGGFAKASIRLIKTYPLSDMRSEIFHGDCLDVLRDFEDETFDLIITSPPYADRRAHTYGGVKPDQYVSWFLPRAAEFRRVLKQTGSFVLNIKEKAEDGERHTFVIELILALRQQGWLWGDAIT